ncbi:MAG TPA: condensation domain-containing protein, partial [Longimicrobium sp.]|nr:condensation domain-containing protein [Longimicrobium sp.]
MRDLAERLAALPPEARRLLELRMQREKREAGSAPVRRGAERAPLSFAQERLWFLDRMEPGSPFYNMPSVLQLGGALDVSALERALGGIIHRHEALRTVFREADGAPEQVITPFAGFALPVEDLSALDADAREAEVRRLSEENAARPFDLGTEPLIRASLLRLGEDEHVLLLCIHHIASDGWSLGVLFRELWALYDAYARGGESRLAPLPIQYADYAVWQREQLRGEVLDRELAWWRERLAGAPALLELPTDRPRPAVQTYRGASESVALPDEVMERLHAMARDEGATLYMVLLAAFQVLLAKYGGGDDVVVGSPIAGRTQPEVEGLIGFFVNTLVMRTELSGDPDFRAVVRRVRATTLGAYAHQEVPFERLVAELQPDRSPSHSPLFQVMFVLTEGSSRVDGPEGMRVDVVEADTATSKFDLTLGLRSEGGSGSGDFVYNTDLFDAGTIRRMARHLERLLEQVSARPDLRVSRVELLDASERAQLVDTWNRTTTKYPREASIHQLVTEQAARTPGATAVVFGDETLTYAELYTRSNRLAHHLVALGVGPDVRVGICLERSAELVVAMLAVLKAGGAYVPLDAEYPRERLAFMVADSGARALVTQESLRAALPIEADVAVVSVDGDHARIAAAPAGAPRMTAGPRSLAYVIYTSGSTGTPKGAAVEHRSVVRLVRDTNYVSLGPTDRVGQVANLSFDAATFEVWGALLNGAALVGIDRDVALSPVGLPNAIRDQRITTMFLTVALFNAIARERPEAFASLTTLLVGGEACDPVSMRRVLEAGGPRRLLNGYGPTENTTFSAWHHVQHVAADAHTVPIGRTIAHSTPTSRVVSDAKASGRSRAMALNSATVRNIVVIRWSRMAFGSP